MSLVTFISADFKIKGSIEDNAKIISLFPNENILFLNENIWCDHSLEPSRRDGSNKRSQDLLLWRNMKKYPLIVSVTPSYLKHLICVFL